MSTDRFTYNGKTYEVLVDSYDLISIPDGPTIEPLRLSGNTIISYAEKTPDEVRELIRDWRTSVAVAVLVEPSTITA